MAGEVDRRGGNRRFRFDDDATVAFTKRLGTPKSRGSSRSIGSWGLARKLLNIYIRDCVYSRMLCAHYRLEAIEPFLEVPLDSFTGKALNAEAKARGQTHRLPDWQSIKGLEREESDRFQAFASELAEERGHARVHLDVLMWGARE